MARRVVVTGIGLVCGVGHTTDEVWSNLLAGKIAGIHPLTRSFFASWLDDALRAELAQLSRPA